MKITFSNLGAIKKTTLDLRPLTVIIGPNNSNKTYIAYSIYGLLQSILKIPAPLFFDEQIVQSSGDTFFLKINDELIDSFIKDCEARIKEFENELEIFFQDSSKRLFDKTNYKISVTKKEVKKGIRELADNEYQVFYKSFRFRLKNNILYGDALKSKKENEPIEASEMEFAYTFMWCLRHTLFTTPFPFPAERNALIITYKVLENRRYKMLKKANRALIKNSTQLKQPSLFYGGSDVESENIRYPQPVEDFLDFLTNVELESIMEVLDEFSELADYIEKFIQSNNKTKIEFTKLGWQEIKINVKKDLDIDLYNASSSIKQLAPLLLYLRYRAKKNDLLIIDEPEMNLHPESQAKLLEVLGMLVNAGVNVLLTTHSPYFMSHLNNLISGDMTDEKIREKQAKSLYLEDARAFLSPDDVSAYEMKKDRLGNQKLHDLKDKDYGIRWDTLSDVSADIQQKFFEIYEQKEETSKGKEN